MLAEHFSFTGVCSTNSALNFQHGTDKNESNLSGIGFLPSLETGF